MRPGEQHGVDYLFVTAQQFEEWIEAGALLEHAVVYGDYKGIPLSQARGARLRFVSSTGPLRRGRGAARGPGGSPPRRGRARAGDRRAGARHGRHPAPGCAGRRDCAAAPAGRRVRLPGARPPALRPGARPPRLRGLRAPNAKGVLQLPPASTLHGLVGCALGIAAGEVLGKLGRRGGAAGTAGGGLRRAGEAAVTGAAGAAGGRDGGAAGAAPGGPQDRALGAARPVPSPAGGVQRPRWVTASCASRGRRARDRGRACVATRLALQLSARTCNARSPVRLLARCCRLGWRARGVAMRSLHMPTRPQKTCECGHRGGAVR